MILASPESMTVPTPSMVTEVSAMLVARTILRVLRRLDGEVLLLGSQAAVEGYEKEVAISGQDFELTGAPFDPRDARKEDQNVAGVEIDGPSDGGRCNTGRISFDRLDAWITSTGCCRTSQVMRGQSPRKAATGSPSRVADMTTNRRSGRT